MNYSILFPRYAGTPNISLVILYLRLIFGILFMLHGIDKLENFSTLSNTFPSILGLSRQFALILTIFTELVCSIAFMIGFLFRIAIIPMIISMTVAFTAIHNSSISQGELAFIYLSIFTLLAITGPGRYSIDYPLGSYIMYKDDTNSPMQNKENHKQNIKE